jgi:hypothetical protein
VALGDTDVAARFALRACGGECDVLTAGVEDFEFVDAWLQVVRGLDGEAHAFGFGWRKTIRVFSGVDHGALGAGFHQGHEAGEFFVDLGEARLETFGLRACGLGLRRAQIAVAILDSGDEGLHGVVVFGRDGIEFVIVAARAADAEAEEGLADVHDDFIDGILPREPLGLIVFTDLAGQQARRR